MTKDFAQKPVHVEPSGSSEGAMVIGRLARGQMAALRLRRAKGRFGSEGWPVVAVDPKGDYTNVLAGEQMNLDDSGVGVLDVEDLLSGIDAFTIPDEPLEQLHDPAVAGADLPKYTDWPPQIGDTAGQNVQPTREVSHP